MNEFTSRSKVSSLTNTSPLKLDDHDSVHMEDETNVSLVEGTPIDLPPHGRYDESEDNGSRSAYPHTVDGRQVSCQNETGNTHSGMETTALHIDRCSFLYLPVELIDSILMHLAAVDLCSISATCRKLHKQAMSEFHWLRCIRDHVPGLVLSCPGPCETFRELYKAHDPVWFLPKYKVWFCDRDMMGKLIIVRFDPRRGCIEGYQVLAVNNKQTFEEWPARNDVFILSFEPHVKLHLDRPVLQLNIGDTQNVRNHAARTGANRFAAEVPMMRGDRRDLNFNNFMLTRPLDPGTAGANQVPEYPYDYVWPPPAVPSDHRVSGTKSNQSVVGNIAPHDTPMSRGEISHQTFRIRQWTQMAGTGSPLTLLGDQNGGIAGLLGVVAELGNVVDAGRVHIGEEVITYSTLDTILYTPTESKPWRGIWVGDYSGHGCEFLLIHQPDDPAVTDAELGLVRRVDETDEAWEERRRETYIYRGRLEAIKLTGDPNVPRGEYTFVADDLGPEGFVGIASDPPFTGTRIVKSRGHVAGTGFVNDRYTESQLLLIGPNRLAQYWVEFGHISFFERVQIDQLLVPP